MLWADPELAFLLGLPGSLQLPPLLPREELLNAGSRGAQGRKSRGEGERRAL